MEKTSKTYERILEDFLEKNQNARIYEEFNGRISERVSGQVLKTTRGFLKLFISEFLYYFFCKIS